jgi:hypothetical protein
MLGSVRAGAFSRALAALVAVALSGAPSLASALRPEPAHVCQCRAHGIAHRCACPICASAVRAARRGALKDLPACHRGAALADLAEEEAHAAREATLTCVEPTCGGAEKLRTHRGVGLYFLPRPPTLSPPRGVERLVAVAVREAEVPSVPDVPPPKGP